MARWEDFVGVMTVELEKFKVLSLTIPSIYLSATNNLNEKYESRGKVNGHALIYRVMKSGQS